QPAAPTRPDRPDRPSRPATKGSPPGAARAFARYVGLTAVNPTTALYFAALTTAQGAALGAGPAAAGAFLAGVGLASLAWQQLLANVGAFAGDRISGTARAWTFRLGYGLVAAYAVKIALPLP
ncbi:lysine transporter LysE, partial [Streptomyces bambusae]|nr:lysine transporter LysE [Streptomyces bambusae]